MARRRWTIEEVTEWRKGHRNGFGYCNKEDSNIFVPKTYGFGWSMNWANPVSWVIIAVIIAFIVWRVAGGGQRMGSLY